MLSGNININTIIIQLIYYLSSITQKCKGRVPLKIILKVKQRFMFSIFITISTRVGQMDSKEMNDCLYLQHLNSLCSDFVNEHQKGDR